jgi:hypothetical protein
MQLGLKNFLGFAINPLNVSIILIYNYANLTML